jgi:hypothetical protein
LNILRRNLKNSTWKMDFLGLVDFSVAGGMAAMVEHLPGKNKDQSSNSSTAKNKKKKKKVDSVLP